MKKRIIALLLCLLLVIPLAACGNNNNPDPCANGHDWGEWATVTEATETATGLKERECNRCGEKEQGTISKTGINFTAVYAAAIDLGFTGSLDDLIAAFKGDSAYMIAKENGYDGTEDEWLETLVGAGGSKGADGLTPHIQDGFWHIGDTNTGVRAHGKSAYEIYIENHPDYQGSEEQWLDDLINGRLATATYTVTFDTLGGSDIEPISVKSGGKVNKPNDPVKESDILADYTFDGWYISPDDFSTDNRWSFIGYIATEDMTLYAKWIEILPEEMDVTDPASRMFFGFKPTDYNAYESEWMYEWIWEADNPEVIVEQFYETLKMKGYVLVYEVIMPTIELGNMFGAQSLPGYMLCMTPSDNGTSTMMFKRPKNETRFTSSYFGVEPKTFRSSEPYLVSGVCDWSWDNRDLSEELSALLTERGYESFDEMDFTFLSPAQKWHGTRVTKGIFGGTDGFSVEYFDGTGNISVKSYFPKGSWGGGDDEDNNDNDNNVTDDEIRMFFGISPDNCWSNENGASHHWKFENQNKFDELCAALVGLGYLQTDSGEWSMDYSLSGTQIGRYIRNGMIRFRISYGNGSGTTREAEFHFKGEGDNGWGALTEQETRMYFNAEPDYYNYNNESYTHYAWEWNNQNLYDELCTIMVEKGYIVYEKSNMSNALGQCFTRVEHLSNSDLYHVQFFDGTGNMVRTIFGLSRPGEDEELPNVNGIYVIHILFPFSDEQREYFNGNMSAGMPPAAEREMYTDAAQSLTVEVNEGEYRALFGTGGIFEEIERALTGLTGQAALTVFEEYLQQYNTDPGMMNNKKGYFVQLEGETPYVPPFSDFSLELFNHADPMSSIGNAFINGSLGYCVTPFGVHIIMVKSVHMPK